MQFILMYRDGCPRDGTETVPYREAKLGVNIEDIFLKEDYYEVA
jgi:hypothetical protein